MSATENVSPFLTRSVHDSLATSKGEMAERVRAYDWSQTPLGPIAGWPQSLRTAVNILLSSRYAMWMAWGPELTFLCNDAYLPTLGIKQPWALGSPTAKVWEEIWPDVGSRIDSVLDTGISTYDEGLRLFLERSGFREETYHTFSYSPLTDDTGNVRGMLCVVTEETERVIGERRVETLRDVASALAGAITECEVLIALGAALSKNKRDLPFALIYQFDSSGDAHLSCASGISDGHPLAPVTIQGGDSFPWPTNIASPQSEFRIIEDLSAQINTAPIPAGDWDRSPQQAVIVPIRQQSQDPANGFVVVGINPYRRFDEDYSGFLELLVGQITAGLASSHAHERERERADALAEIDRAKTTFFSNVSHEFRTPLTLMLGPIEEILQREGNISHPLRPELELVHRNGLRLQKLVNTLLDFSRIEAGRVQANYEKVDLGELTADIASTFRSAMEKAGLTFTIDCPRHLAPAYVDRASWEKVILNLLSNAFKFTLQGSVEIRLEEDGQILRCSVTDTGTGIPSSELPHIFERFHRVENAQGRSFEGTGIGLALVAELVKLHGGTVSLDSELGKGSTFTVTLPIDAAHIPTAQTNLSHSAPPARTAEPYLEEALQWLHQPTATSISDSSALASGSTRTGGILLADDNADMRDYVRRLLSQSYEVEAVSNGAQALAAIERERPDLILSDVMMPEVNGFELLRAIRSNPQTKDIPVILLSARSGEESRVEGIDAGADDYLVKPFSAHELSVRVGAHLERARARKLAQDQTAELNRQLQDRVNELEALLAVLPVGIGIALDPDCKEIQINPAFAAMLEVPVGPNAKTALDFERPVHFKVFGDEGSEIANGDLPMRVTAREGREIKEFECDVVLDNGRKMRLLEYASPLFDHSGQPRGSVAAFIDITERRRSEAKDRFLLLLDDSTRCLSDPNEITFTAMRLLGEHLKADRAAYVEVDSSGSIAHVVANFTPSHPTVVGSYSISDYSPPLHQAMLRGETYICHDIDHEDSSEVHRDRFRTLQIRAHLSVPLQKEGRVVAAITVHQAVPRRWNREEIDLAELVANRCWESIERSRVLRALHESEQRLAIAQSAGGIGTFDWDIPTGAIVWTEQEERLFGIAPGTFEGNLSGWAKRVEPEDAQRIMVAFEQDWIERRRDVTFEFRVIWPDGQRRHIAGGGRFFYDPSGRPVRMVGVNIDLTEQRLAEKALRESEERFRTMADNIAQFAWMTDPAGWIFWFNQRWYDYTGTTLEQVQGAGWRTMVHPQHVERVFERYRASIQSGAIWEDEFPIRGSNGEWRWFLSRARPIRDAAGKVIRWFGTNTDITAQREVESELRRANSDLEQFAYSASHDLKEPLRNVTIYSELIADRYGEGLDAQGLQFLEYVKEGSLRMEELIGDLLAYTQIRNDQDAVDESADAQAVLQDALNALSGAIRESNAELLADPLPTLRMNGMHLMQLLQNLIGNALKYRNSEQPTKIYVIAEEHDDYWRLAVKDNGIGIHPDYWKTIFGIFKRLHTRDNYSGTGIGLAICHRIVERYGGRIWVESELGRGSTFYFTIPK